MSSRTSVSAVFVYGTLRRGQLRESSWPYPPLSVVQGFIRASLYDLGPYPAITAGDDVVEGELWTLDQRHISATLAVLDKIEGYIEGRPDNLYERIVVDVHPRPECNGRSDLCGYVYRMDAAKIPATAVRVYPQVRLGSSSPSCHWPPSDKPPGLTSLLPDPYPDDVARPQ